MPVGRAGDQGGRPVLGLISNAHEMPHPIGEHFGLVREQGMACVFDALDRARWHRLAKSTRELGIHDVAVAAP
jgi:hypothetical protein